MTSHEKRVQTHRKLLQQARALARSGRHENHKSIFAELEPIEGFAEARTWIGEGAIRAQLDKLCLMVRERPVAQSYRRASQ